MAIAIATPIGIARNRAVRGEGAVTKTRYGCAKKADRTRQSPDP
ncbi:MAG: hypothetical protein ABSC30_14420 [Acidimicrobiales bacterium]